MPHWTPGLTLYLPPETDSHIMDFPHHRILHSMSGMNFQDEVMYLRGRHTTNDSDGWGGQFGEPFAEARATDVLRRRFGIDLPRFARTCAAIRALAALSAAIDDIMELVEDDPELVATPESWDRPAQTD